LVEGLLVGIQLIKKHKPKDTRSVMRFANRVLFSMMWEIMVGQDTPNHKYLFTVSIPSENQAMMELTDYLQGNTCLTHPRLWTRGSRTSNQVLSLQGLCEYPN